MARYENSEERKLYHPIASRLEMFRDSPLMIETLLDVAI